MGLEQMYSLMIGFVLMLALERFVPFETPTGVMWYVAFMIVALILGWGDPFSVIGSLACMLLFTVPRMEREQR